MNSKIIITQDIKGRIDALNQILKENKLHKDHPDLFYITDEEKLGVEQVKKIREFLSFKPHQAKGKAIVLESAHNLTLDAQNALLKTLEEPPQDSLILLGIEKEDDLLPTVLSRCEIIRIQRQESRVQEAQFTNQIEKLERLSFAERFEVIEKLEDKEQFFNELMIFYQQKLRENPKYLDFTKKLIETEKWKNQSGNIRAILEYLMLELP